MSDETEVVREIERLLQEWADENITGKVPLSEDAVAEFKLMADIFISKLLPEEYKGELMNVRMDEENDAIVSDGVRVWKA